VTHLASQARQRVPAERQAEFYFWNREPRRFAGNAQVAAGSEDQGAADGEALDGGDRNLVEALDRRGGAAADARVVPDLKLVARPRIAPLAGVGAR